MAGRTGVKGTAADEFSALTADIVRGTWTAGGQYLVPNSTAAAPAIGFLGAPTHGLYRFGNGVGFAGSGLQCFGFNDTAGFIKTHAAFADSELVPFTRAYQTVDATPTTIATVAISDAHVYSIEVTIRGRENAGADRATWKRFVQVYREGGAPTLSAVQELLPVPIKSAGAALWDVTFAVSANNVLVQVTGAAATTINWSCAIEQQAVGGAT